MPSLPFRTLCAKLRAAIKSLSAADRAALDGALPHLIANGSTYAPRMNAGDFLWLCARLGIDPLTGDGVKPITDPGALCLASIGAGMTVQRHLKGMALEEVARETGVSRSTLWRIETNLPVSIESVLDVCAFIGVHPFHYLVKQREAA